MQECLWKEINMYKIQYGKPTNKRKKIIGKAKDIEKANIIVYDFI